MNINRSDMEGEMTHAELKKLWALDKAIERIAEAKSNLSNVPYAYLQPYYDDIVKAGEIINRVSKRISQDRISTNCWTKEVE